MVSHRIVVLRVGKKLNSQIKYCVCVLYSMCKHTALTTSNKQQPDKNSLKFVNYLLTTPALTRKDFAALRAAMSSSGYPKAD